MILHKCTKNHDHMRLGCRDMAQDKQVGYFGPMFGLYPCRGSKNLNFQKKRSIPTLVPQKLFDCRVMAQRNKEVIFRQFLPFYHSGDLKIKTS